MHKGLRLALLTAALTFSAAVTPAVAAPAPLKPLHFNDVSAMIEDAGDYSAEKGTFKLISSSPLHIRMSPPVMQSDLPRYVAQDVVRAALYGVYRTFIHTDAAAVIVTSVPAQITLNPYTVKLQIKPELEISVTREQALKAVRVLVDADDLADLVEPEQAGDIQLDNWRKDFEDLYSTADGKKALLEALETSGAKVSFKG
ncbi:hypothetical protein [Pseudomonas denitrificans (nom. rej.)]|uniref:DUF3313 domain-containing protein n=1 Tax=Pseudomonas denitrificans TaxID=43306 RepID=A0A9X7R645_PSEDE|nr:hypothetical protein [Pseudomonas denitrificans (nom. rej.)]QEY74109.1 hypothetical protein F1C79_22260 [Pseudomonas denitrificans (nom. rej.)]